MSTQNFFKNLANKISVWYIIIGDNMPKRIMVAGSANMDVVLRLISLPSDGESVLAGSRDFIPGGKGANRAVALARLNANPLFSCMVGTDDFGDTLCGVYRTEGIDTTLVSRCENAGTGVAYILVDSMGNNCIAVYSGANGLYGSDCIKKATNRFNEVSFLSLELEIPPSSIEELCFEGHRKGVPTIIDAGPIRKDFDKKLLRGAFLLSPNQSEAEALTGIKIRSRKDIEDACRSLFTFGVNYAHIKLGDQGSVCYDGQRFIDCPANSTGEPVLDTTAAGDCYMAALCFRLSGGSDMESAMRYASAAAGISVTRSGAITSLPTLNEVSDLICAQTER